MSNYPSALDSDATLPSALDGASENTSEALNKLKDAVIAIEKSIGLSPQGSLADLVSRLSVALNANGTLKASALIAAGMVALPITNSQISSSAAIAESKLDLDFATSTLNSALNSHEIDINALQVAVLNLISSLAQHVSGDADNHDGYAIFLDNLSPYSAPSWLEGIDAHDVSTAIMLLAQNASNHTSSSAVGAHKAANISVDAFSIYSADNLQNTLESLAGKNSIEVIAHQDSMHANGVSRWENSADFWNPSRKKYPVTGTTNAIAVTSNILQFTGANLVSLGVVRGDVVVIADTPYKILDVGPRAGIGGKPLLSSEQVELAESVVSGATYTSEIFAKSSIFNLKTPLTSTVFPGNSSVDTLLIAQPNSAKIVSLGLKPYFLSSSDTLAIEVGSPDGSIRNFTVSNLNKDRLGSTLIEATPFSIVDRINYVLNSSAVANRALASAYVIGDEIAIIHHLDTANCTLKITSSTSASLSGANALGFGAMGANTLNKKYVPGDGNHFYVDGQTHGSIPSLWSGAATISGSTFAVPVSVDLSSAGVKKGCLVCILTGPSAAQIGTYQITSVSGNSISVAETITAGSCTISVIGNAVSLSDLDGASSVSLTELFINREGRANKSLRLTYVDAISGVKITNASDGLVAGTYTLNSSLSGNNLLLRLSTNLSQKPTIIPSDFKGIIKVYGPSNIDYVDVELNGSAGTGSSIVTVYDHVDEEDLFEISQVRLSGRIVQSITDKRMFGTVGIDEIREDVVQSYIESPLADLRGNGVVRGFDVLQDNIDGYSLGFPSGTRAVYIDGGIGYVDGVRVSQVAQYVGVPSTAGTYIICIDTNSSIVVKDQSVYPIENMLSGKVMNFLPLALVTNSGSAITSKSCVYRISKVDDKLDLVLDLTDSYVGNFNDTTAAITYLNSFPDSERKRLVILSRDPSIVDLSSLSVETEIVIDGYVGTLIVSANCSISSVIPNRVNANIGSLSISASDVHCSKISVSSVIIDATTLSGGNYSFKGCVFLNDVGFSVTDPSNVVESILVSDCESIGSGFLFNVESTNCDFKCVNSKLISEGGTSILTTRNVYLEDSVFDNFKFSSTQSSSDSAFEVTNCEFVSTVGTVISAPSVRVSLHNTDFKYINLNLVSPTCCLFGDANVSNVGFYNISASYSNEFSNGMLISASENSTVSGVELYNSTLTNYLTPTIKAGTVSGVVNKTTGELSIGAKNISNSYGVTFVKKPYSSLFVSDCVLDAVSSPTLLYFSDNVSLSNVKLISDSGTGIKAEVSSVSNFNVRGCSFETTSSGSSFELDSVLTFDGSFSDCKFAAAIAANSASISGIRFFNNEFANSFVLEVGSDVVFDGCDFTSLTINGTYLGVSVKNCSASGQILFSGNGSNTSITNTNGPIVISGNQSRILFSDNHCSLTTLTFSSITGVVSNNVFDLSTSLSNFEFSSCRLIGNLFRGSTIQFLSNGKVFIESNAFNGNVEIGNFFSSSSFKSNNALSTSSTLTVSASVTSANIEGNANFNYVFTGQLTGAIFSNNVGSASASFAGRTLNCRFDNNSIDDVVFSSNDIELMMIKGHVGTSLQMTSTSGSINKVLISNSFISNVVVCDGAISSQIEKLYIDNLNGEFLKIFPNLSSVASIGCNELSVNSSTVSSVELFNGATTTSQSVERLSFTKNICENIIFTGATSGLTELTIDGLILNGNRVGNLLFGKNAVSGTNSLLAIKNTNISDNIIEWHQSYLVNSDSIVVDSNSIRQLFEFYCVATFGLATLKNLKFTNNNCIGVSAKIESIDLTGTTDFSTYCTGINIDSNSMNSFTFGSGFRENTKDISSLSVCDNVFGPMISDGSPSTVYGLFFKSANNDSSSTTQYKSIVVSRNRCFIYSTSATSFPFVIDFDCLSRATQVFKANISDNSGLLLTSSNTTLAFSLANSRIHGNEILGTSLDLAGGFIDYFVISANNIIGTFDIVNGGASSSLIISDNSGTADMQLLCDSFLSHVFVNNTVTSYKLESALSDITRAVISNNHVSDSIFLDKNTSFSTGIDQSKITNNYAQHWVGNASSPIATSGSNRIFAWGNTGTTATNVTFTGTVATNISTANNLTGSGITA